MARTGGKAIEHHDIYTENIQKIQTEEGASIASSLTRLLIHLLNRSLTRSLLIPL